ncbi:bactofilin family protein [Sulfurospirillum barnesii]|uniref:Integral membrane protein CcmA involved in cell shape determination n=1 Tax=Sulfurospirillum barnesii (strain ATCC 700032 / DSM 10660 / SES-3) TaxID=760154 RepID=I3XYE5_SULBS|nr:polymer-forming cytoskeletal protein [Sulfurospirillum barnesii]AFL68969.1 Integral membrane protein CcmA involved in cell shape determination [Sulfurospirillum barnesii SES-3]
MGIFNKADQCTIPASETTIIASGAKVEGVFKCQTRLHVDGEIIGKVLSDSIVTIGKQGCISGEIHASRLIVNGLFEGNADCENVEVLEGGKFLGKVFSKELVIEAKAIFEGESKIKTESMQTLTYEEQRD